ncbi:MAG TPA: hypothetical protein PLZ52_02045 [Bacteroidales bacterium]|nr:hypothetical protein [Bacteroidales bacterium]HQL70206.1 hypothetical protein [Bacteroidales bacterium]
MMKWGVYILAFIAASLLFTACFHIESYPPEPQIELKYFTLTDSVDGLGNPVLNGELCISFVDGDGDIGYQATSDTAAADTLKTVFIKKYLKEDGVFKEVYLAVPLNFRVPYFESEGNNPTLKGEIIVHDLNSNPPFAGDTIKYSVYIKDRAGHKSNTIETPIMVLSDSLP